MTPIEAPFSATAVGSERANIAPTYPMRRQNPIDPPVEIGELREQRPITKVRIWDGTEPWLVTRYDDVRDVLADQRFSADFSQPGYPGSSVAVKLSREVSPWFVNMDDPAHAVYRRMLTAEFAVKRIEAYRPMVLRLVEELLSEMEKMPRPVDLVQVFALALPSLVVCEILGIPYQDREFWQESAKALFDVSSTPEVGAKADADLRAYLASILEDKRRNPGDDLLSRLDQKYIATGQLKPKDASAMALLLLVAGHETTANMIALGTMVLLDHPDQAAAVFSGDTETVAGAVEELLRLLTVVHTGRRRVAIADMDLSGVHIKPGEGVIASEPAANRDPAQFESPDTLDIHRENNHHLAFGYGVHRCLGQPLARLELQLAYPALLQRFPHLRIAVPQEELQFRDSMIVYGVSALPVEWSPKA